MGQVGEFCVPGAAAFCTEFGAAKFEEAILSRNLTPGSKVERSLFFLMATRESEGWQGTPGQKMVVVVLLEGCVFGVEVC